jgi:oligopeptide/dipeptide ABC transporter ATP-binding protein
MKQRVMIALALAAEPALLVADEPTTALDVTIQAQVLALLRDLQQRLGMAILLITHDLGIVAGMAHRIAVMYAGEIVEIGAAADVLERPAHPYSAGLLATSASLDRRDEFLHELPGEPGQRVPEQGCAFAPRCVHVMEACRSRSPALVETSPGHAARCLLHVR